MTEKYSPQKHEEGTPEASGWAKSMTPGQDNSDGFPAGKKGNSEPKKKLKSFYEHLDVLDEAVELKNPGLKDGQWYCGDADWFDYAVEVKNKEVLPLIPPAGVVESDTQVRENIIKRLRNKREWKEIKKDPEAMSHLKSRLKSASRF